MIVIFTGRDDLHALTVYDHINRGGAVRCSIVECDHIAQGNNVSYRLGGGPQYDRVRSHNGELIAFSDASLIWLRRIRANQVLTNQVSESEGYEIINNDCRGALSGLLGTKFHGRWFSHPEASFRASDKVFQLAIAAQNGMRIPKTLVSQSRLDVEEFFDECRGQVIVKTVVGVNEPFLQTRRLAHYDDFTVDSYEACPAIYQECIDGDVHLRILAFGGNFLAGMIRTKDLDWRPNLNVSITPFDIPRHEQEKINSVLDALGLTMGIIDIKITPEGEYVWLEVNPQGQFLFLEPLTGIPFIREISDFFVREAREFHS